MKVAVPYSAISFRSVVALVDRYPVLAGADLTVEPGECVLLTGANGAGKTSLLRAIAALLPITSGAANVMGWDVYKEQQKIRRDVGYLSHGTALYSDLTARENVDYAVRAARRERSDTDNALRAFGLDDKLADVPVHRLSAGQRRRAALASLVAKKPPLWLLDEPFTGLDSNTRELLKDAMAAAVQTGVTVLFSSHEEHDIEIPLRHVCVAGGLVEAKEAVADVS